ncbi:hypothetical protein VE01_10336 [Pseudogymnoascus verrucosus]|uniref:Peptidase S53 domain-containing protein n=1 Tax=Pseudogymnoascus verrucosus TaxID=342668 RepID=A0A1B8G770_9PEZI|nr:uncharacterized protein VE01_10336 [Pseudogymnoascus verrucosus]OBT91678.1 hypothetical protein VE01_10336 [Pseudogymnoascus verrucosus]
MHGLEDGLNGARETGYCRDTVADGWTKTSHASADTPLNLRIGLKQLNLEQAEELVNAVSHPRSETYGQYWAPQQILEMFAPSSDAVSDTIVWLLEAGVPRSSIALSAGKNWIKVDTTVGVAESLLDTTYGVYESSEEDFELVACEAYSVPADVRRHIDLVTPTIQFDTRGTTIRQRVKKRDVLSPNPRKLPGWHKNHKAESLDNCREKEESVEGNSYGIVEYAPQSYNHEDLNGFFSVYDNVPNDTAPILERFDGGYLSKETGSGTRGKSNLDLCGGVVWNLATNNNFLDAIDGSYCTFEGGDITWDATYPHDASSPDAYTGEPKCGTQNATHVISVSYGRNEDARPASYTARKCTEYMKLTLMGATIMFSSGDTGVTGISGRYLNEDGSYTPRSPNYGRFAPCEFPSITSIVTLRSPVNGTIHDREIVATRSSPGGGFSNIFALPSYQAETVASYYGHHDPGYNFSQYNNMQQVHGYPDVSLNAQSYITGIVGGFQAFTGTSASSPTFGAMITLINGARIAAGTGPVGFINPVLYEHREEIFNDVVEGHTSGCGTDGFTAVEGWDPASGLGTPDFVRLKKVLMRLP